MNCPDDLKRRAEILNCNGFKGFQSPGTGAGENNFMICWCDDDLPSGAVTKIKEISGSQTLYHGYYIGRGYMTVNWTEYNKIISIFNAMLSLGHWFQTGNKGEAGFSSEQGDTNFTFEIMEKKTVSQFTELIDLCPAYATNKYPISNIYCDIWNYETTEGKDFCNFLREKRKLGPATLDHDDNYFNWEIFKNCDFNTLQTIVPEIIQNEVKLEQVEDNTCMICLSAEANTMVLPCEHCVVCTECSVGLRNTPDKKICVRCRREITHVLES